MAQTPIKVELRSVDALIPYVRNARTHSDAQVAQIAASIKEFGWTNPMLVDGDNGVIAGHGRLLAARKLDMKEVPVIELSHLSENQKKALILADNQLALNADWDKAMLRLEFDDLVIGGFDTEIIGFDDAFIDEFMDSVETNEGLTDEDAVPDIPKNAKTKLGDVFLLGNHRVMCGDATIIDSVQALMDGRLADQLVTDPPYNVNYEGGTGLKIANDSMTDANFRQFLRDAFVCADSVMKEGAVFYVWHADSEGFNFRGACKDAGWNVRQCLIWKKSSLVMGRQDYHWQHEPCLYGWKDGSAHLWASDRKQTTILEFDKPTRNDIHPTMKPVALIEYQILNNTKGSDIVLDLFGGGGSTLIACEKNGRAARIMELDPKYCDVMIKRWEDFTGEKAVHEQSGQIFAELA